jgi:hypothetical protein
MHNAEAFNSSNLFNVQGGSISIVGSFNHTNILAISSDWVTVVTGGGTGIGAYIIIEL